MKNRYFKWAAMALILGSSFSAIAGDKPSTMVLGLDEKPQVVDLSARKSQAKGFHADVAVEFADPNNKGLVSRFTINLETPSLKDLVSNDKNSKVAFFPAQVKARIESENHGDAETMVDLAQVSLVRMSDGDSNSGVSADVLQYKYEENNDENLSYSSKQTLNLVSVAMRQLIKQGYLPHSSIPVKIFISGGLDLGVGKADLDEADTDTVFTYNGCGSAELTFAKSTIINEICNTYVDADVFGTGSSEIDSTSTTDGQIVIQLHQSPIELTVGIRNERYDNDADSKTEGRLGARWKF